MAFLHLATLDRTSAITLGGHLIQKNHQQKYTPAQNVALNGLWEARLFVRREPRREGQRSPCSTSARPAGQGTQIFFWGGWGLCSAACRILVPWPGIEPVPPLKGKHRVLTTRTPVKLGTQNLLHCLCEWPGKHPKYRFLGYRRISASRQICRYRSHKQWSSTTCFFGFVVLAMAHGM